MLLFAGDRVLVLQFPLSGGSQIETSMPKSVVFFVRLLGCLPFWLSWPKPLRGLVCYSISTHSSTYRFQCASSLCGQCYHDFRVPSTHGVSAAAKAGPNIVFQLVSIAFEFWLFLVNCILLRATFLNRKLHFAASLFQDLAPSARGKGSKRESDIEHDTGISSRNQVFDAAQAEISSDSQYWTICNQLHSIATFWTSNQTKNCSSTSKAVSYFEAFSKMVLGLW